MADENSMPDWADHLFETIASTIEFKGFAEMEGYYLAPEENDWGVHLLEMAPVLMEVMESGPNDGEHVYGVINNIDLLAVQDALDSVSALGFGFENDGSPVLTVEGSAGGRELVLRINALPFPDDDDTDDGGGELVA